MNNTHLDNLVNLDNLIAKAQRAGNAELVAAYRSNRDLLVFHAEHSPGLSTLTDEHCAYQYRIRWVGHVHR